MSKLHIIGSKAFFGRYDCPHAGSAYNEINVRAHFFIDPIKKTSDINWRSFNSVYFKNNTSIEWVDYENYFEARKLNAAKATAARKANKEDMKKKYAVVRAKKIKK